VRYLREFSLFLLRFVPHPFFSAEMMEKRTQAVSARCNLCATMLFCSVTAEVAGASPVFPSRAETIFSVSEGRNSNRADLSARSPWQAIS
jgi:hypothetical protein